MNVGTIAIYAIPCVAVAFCLGVWLGARLVARHMLETITDQGFYTHNGVRYRVDRIGRKPKGE